MPVKHLEIDVWWHEDAGVRRVITFRRLLDRVIAATGGSLVDLGAGHCLFSRYARDRGYQVTAVDARKLRLPGPDELCSIRFVCADVRDFDVSGFDVILMLGLLYHLDLEDQIGLLRRCATGAVLIVDTQVHYPELISTGGAKPWQTTLVRVGEYEGVVYPENDNPMAAVGNSTSFWHTERSFIRLFVNSGLGDITVVDPIYLSKYGGRRFFVLHAGDQDRASSAH